MENNLILKCAMTIIRRESYEATIKRSCLIFPGKASDSRVYRETGVKDFVDGLESDQHLIGDAAFGLSRGLMKPYNYEGATEEQEYFNFKLSSSRMVIECLFGQLKTRFRC